MDRSSSSQRSTGSPAGTTGGRSQTFCGMYPRKRRIIAKHSSSELAPLSLLPPFPASISRPPCSSFVTFSPCARCPTPLPAAMLLLVFSSISLLLFSHFFTPLTLSLFFFLLFLSFF